MSTTRSQKRKNDQQSTGENVSESLISPIVVGNLCSSNQDDEVAGPSKPKSPRIENSLLESLRTSLKEEITSEIKNLLIESQKEMLKLLKPETRGTFRENSEEEVEEETRSFYTPTKSVRISSIQNDPMICRNTTNFSERNLEERRRNNWNWAQRSLITSIRMNGMWISHNVLNVATFGTFSSLAVFLSEFVLLRVTCSVRVLTKVVISLNLFIHF